MKQLHLLLLLLPFFSSAQYSDTTTCLSGMDELTYAVHYDQQQCSDSCSGSYQIEVLVGSGNYLYSVLGNGGFSSTNVQEDFLCVDDYVCIVTDQVTGINCTLLFSVDSLLPFTHSITTTNCTATGSCDGTAELTLAGGIPPYFVTWYTANQQPIPNEDSTYIENLCAGDYYYSVNTSYTDCCDTCTVTACDTCAPYGGTGGLIPFTINEPLGVVLNWTIDEQCEFMCDGMASVSAYGGTGNYTYTISGYPPQNIGDFYNLCPGQYTVDVNDDNGNVGSVTFEILPAWPIMVDVQITHEICANACDGTITTTDLGGNVVGYSIDGSTYVPSGYFDNLCPGQYDLTVETTNGCFVVVGTYTIGPGDSPVINSIQSTDETTQGANDGCITGVTATGGVTPYQYEIDGNLVWTFPVCGLAPGQHEVCVIDNNGCESCTTVVIGPGCGLQATDAVLGTCSGSCDGEATVFITGNTGTANVVWMDSTGNVIGTTETISGLCPGYYFYDVIDSLGCIVSGTVQITEFPSLNVGTNVLVSVATDQDCTGKIQAVASGGTMPYTYEWMRCENNEPVGNTETLSDLCPGTYYLKVTDAQTCSATSGCDTIQDVLSVQSLEGFDWSVTPNPVADNFTVSVTSKEAFDVLFYSAAGTLVHHASVAGGSFTGNTKQLKMASGMYLVEIRCEGRTERKRFVVQ